ncbi:hypothetical protein ACFCXS_34050 [Streptomyces sp. NPDC056373]|uniref:hypothetical protein n=1 Tax=Streptomyces sp. NPDC056373 TaxID=3345798 RepID=UPI0035DF105D
MDREPAKDRAAATRQARYGKLPERIRFADMAEEVQATPRTGVNALGLEGSWKYYSCLALDLGL